MRSVALWRDHRGVTENQAALEAKVTELQSRVQELEFEVSRTTDLESEIETLKQDIQTRDQIIKARDMDLAQARNWRIHLMLKHLKMRKPSTEY
jgi:uncharacterized protein (DUF3084 family)